MTTSEKTYTLHPYHPKFAAGMAQMWNESDQQWPGTFTRGVPFDEKRILEWMERVAAIIKFVIEEDQTGKIVGYGDLWEETHRPGACYVALLNVHPEHQGKSLARRMLHEMVNWATEHGYDKVTIGTWPANLKAMPLYKKVGFFWQPGTGVFMENYVPAVRQLPVAQAFFRRHDWYCTYQRELKQIEDEMRHPKTGETKVYILRWQGRSEAGGDLLEAVFDRNGQRLTGFATNDFAAYARPGDSEPAQGVTYPIEWEVSNNSPREMTVSLLASGDPGIEITHRATFALSPGETRTLSAAYRVAPDAPKFEVDDEEKITPLIHTLLVLDGQVLEFGSGLRYRPPVEFSLGPNGITLTPGQATPIHLQIKNRTKHPLDLAVTLTPHPTFETDWRRETLTVPAQGQAGLPLVITPSQNGEIPLTVQASFTVENQAITTPAKKLPLLALEPGGLAAGQDDDTIIVQNAFFHVKTKRKGARTALTSHTLNREAAIIIEELGPPFVPRDLEERMFDLHLGYENGAVKLTAAVASGRFPGLVLTREMTFTASSFITVRHRVANTGSTTHEFQLRPNIEFLRWEQMHLTLPLKERFVREHASHFGTVYNDIPEDPSRFAEQWLAYEEAGQVFGSVWPANLEKIMGQHGDFSAFSPKQTLAPQETYESAPLYLFFGPGDWRVLRETWARVNGKHIKPAATQQSFEILFSPLPAGEGPGVRGLMTLDGQLDACLKLNNTRGQSLTGGVTLTPPDGWRVNSRGVQTSSDEFLQATAVPMNSLSEVTFPLTDLTFDNPAEFPVTFTAEFPQPGAYEGTLHLNTQRFNHTQPFTLLQLGRSTETVQVTQTEREGFALWEIANGQTAWEIAPSFHGGVISWRENGEEINHLLTAFPQDGELSWIKPFFGGLRPTLHAPLEDRGWPGKLHTEAFAPSPVEARDARGLSWQGVRLTADLQQETFRGLRAELDYLTLPGSNVLKFVYRLVNQTSVYRDVETGLLIFTNVDGSHEKTALHNTELHRKRTDQMAWTVLEGWAAAENPDTGRALALIPASGPKRTQFVDWGLAGGHMHIFYTTQVKPDSTIELVAYLALAGSVEEARRYEALGK